MSLWKKWFSPQDSLDTVANFVVCLPFLFLVTPPLLAAQLPWGFLPLTLLGWLGLPWLTWQTAQWAYRKNGRVSRRGWASLLLWLGLAYSFSPMLLLVAGLFWQSKDYPWVAGMAAIQALILWEAANRWRDYARPSINAHPQVADSLDAGVDEVARHQ